jgi:outer membrane receptor protein involved in Fe transport
VYGAVSYHSVNAADVTQHFDPASGNPGLTTDDKEQPLVFAGYHHEWNPGLHTLFLAGYVNEKFSVQNSNAYTLFLGVDGRMIGGVSTLSSVQQYESKADIYSAELQQIWQTEHHDTVIGARVQYGHFKTSNLQTSPSDFTGAFTDPMASQAFTTPSDRESVYAYHTWRILDPLDLTGGVTYDHLHFPQNYRYAPISDAEDSRDQVSPKAGVIWRMTQDTVLRGAYTKSLGGVSLDQSLRIEPSQVAGFNQAYRSIMPESVVGSSAGEQFETFGGSVEQKFPTRTYVALTGEILNSKAARQIGAFSLDLNVSDTAFPSGTRETLDFREKSLTFSVHQLLGDGFAVGTIYRVSDTELHEDFTQVPSSAFVGPGFSPHTHIRATLHELETHIVYNHSSGLFAEFQALWNLQDNRGYTPALPGDDFWQFNFFGGYRFPGRRAAITFGLLNLTGQDYRLNPLSLYTELARKRTFAAQLEFNF